MTYRIAPNLDTSWMEHGLCRTEQHDPAMWFPLPNEFGTAARAQAVCARCPHEAKCLEFALVAGERHGIWGGKSERQRRNMRAARARTRTTTKQVIVPRTAHGAAVRRLLADRQWHDLDEIVAYAGPHVAEERSLSAFNNNQRANGRTPRAVATSMTAAIGQRIVIRSLIGNMAAREQIERDGAGACRLAYRGAE